MLGSAVFRTGVAPGGALAPGWVKNELWRKARTVPSLDLRFADNKSLVDAVTGAQLVTFTRASSGTFVGSDGLLKTAVTNLVLRSEEFNDAAWTKTNSTVTTNATTAPNGTLTAEKLITNSGASSGRASVSITVATDTPATLSCYAKQGETSVFGLFISDGVTGRSADFDLSTGTVSGTPTAGMTASIQPVGAGWYRCVATVTSVTGTTRSLRVVQTVAANDGTSGLFIWGAQFEQASTVGEYIPTTSVINSAPRFDHNPTTGESLGLLVEEARTNLLLQSEDLATTWTPGTGTVITTNTWTAPDGTLTGDQFTVGTVSTAPSQNVTVAASSSYTLSFYLNTLLTTSAFLRLRFSTLAASISAFFNVSTLAFGTLNGITNPTVQRVGTNVYKLSVTFAYDAVSAGSRAVAISSVTTDNGSTPDTGKIVAIWGMQYELGAFATSYIPTTTATVTRAADVASITGSDFSSWYNQTEGTLFFEGINPAVSTAAFAVSDGSTNNRLQMETGTNTRVARVVSGGTTQASNNIAYTYGASQKFAMSYVTNSINFANAGTLGTEDTSATIPTVDQARIGANPTGANPLNNTIKRLTYWPTRFGGSTLQSITQP